MEALYVVLAVGAVMAAGMALPFWFAPEMPYDGRE